MIFSGVTIVSSPAGTPVSGSTNTFNYPILSSVTLTCMVNPTPSSSVTYQWNTAGCYTNSKFTPNNPQCFPHRQTTQSVTGNDLNAEDAGTITCTVTINGRDYTSEPFTLRISGEQLVYCVIACIVYCKQCMLLLLATCNRCNMGTRDLPDMYTRSPRAEGIHISQIMRAHVTSNMYHFHALLVHKRALSSSSPIHTSLSSF